MKVRSWYISRKILLPESTDIAFQGG